MDDLELLAELEAMDHEENNAQQKQQKQHQQPPPEEEDAEDDDHKAAATAAPPKPHVETKALSGSVDLAMLKRSWARPRIPRHLRNDTTTERVGNAPLRMMQMDLDYIVAPPHHALSREHAGTPETPVVRIFGVTDEGNSVCAFVHGFEPYFYVPAPPNFTPDDVPGFREALNARVGEAQRSAASRGQPTVYVRRVTLEKKQSFMNYQAAGLRPFLKIVMSLPNMVAPARSIMERGLRFGDNQEWACTTYESNVLYALRFMIDQDISGGQWVELAENKYRILPNTRAGGGAASTRAPTGANAPKTACQVEVHVNYRDIAPKDPMDGDWGRIAPMRILSFDIECSAQGFPEAEKNPVIQIASILTVQGQSKDTPLAKVVMTLGTCSDIAGAQVLQFEDERNLLRAFRDLVLCFDPDLITGYNIQNFDVPYLLDRAAAIGCQDFCYLSRLLGVRTKTRDTVFSSKAHGTRESKEANLEGRVCFDVMQAVQRDYKLSSYTLNAVAAHFLGDQKEDVHHSIIADLQNGNADTRARLARYCIKDALLPQRLLDKLMYVYNYVEMARVTGVPLSYLLGRGQMIKVLSQLMRKGKTLSLVVPNLGHQGGGAQGGDDTYEGATVLDAKSGFYTEPVATLDFASLYPSIMQAHNLCYTTLVRKEEVKNFSPDQIERTPTGDVFVRPSVREGVLPQILTELLSARKRAKADLKKEKDPFKKAVLDGRQLALKVSANSVYGFTGATVGKLPCLEISSSTTAFGRQMIEHTKNLVEKKYNKANGYEYDSEVVYGDTDSVFVKFGNPDVAESMRLGEEAAILITETFMKPIKLEFEKVYSPLLLVSKKRYAGLIYTNPDTSKGPDKMDMKGLETVRRDNCGLVRSVLNNVLNKLLYDQDPDAAVAYVKRVISDLLQNKVDLSLLIVSKQLSKREYAAAQPHVLLADRMAKRDPLTAPNIGDRVPYVIVSGTKNSKMSENAEDPIYVLENNVPIDNSYYLENQLKNPLTRLLEPVIGSKGVNDVFHGAHTRRVTQKMPKTGGLMAFAVKTFTCLGPGCRVPIPKKDEAISKAFCRQCLTDPRRVTLGYLNCLGACNEAETRRCKLIVEHARVHELSPFVDNLCASRDCPLYFACKKAEVDHKEKCVIMERFT